jgi:hypothetical protein
MPKATCDKAILHAVFSLSQLRVGTEKHRPITEKGILRRVSVEVSKLLNNSNNTNKRFIIV